MDPLPHPAPRPRPGAARGSRTRLTGVLAVATLVTAAGCALLGPSDGAPADDEVTATGRDASGVGVRDGSTAATATGPSPEALPTFDPGTTVGGYAKGFPRDLLGAPDDASLLASSARPGDGELTDVTLNVSTSRSPQEVLDQFAEPLRKAGFDESGTSTFSALTAQTTFARDSPADGSGDGAKDAGRVSESVTIGVLDDGEERLVTVSGSVRAR